MSWNTNVFNAFMYVMRYSLYKTFAAKYNSTIAKILKKYKKNGRFNVSYRTSKGIKNAFLYDEGFPRKKVPFKYSSVDSIPNVLMYKTRTEITKRLLAEKCEWCNNSGRMEVHHVKKLKNLKEKKSWEILMISRRRKTLVLCHNCHVKLHSGKLD